METFLLWSVLCAAVVLFFDYCRLEWWEKGVDQFIENPEKGRHFLVLRNKQKFGKTPHQKG